jgi:UDP-N-acetylmuramoylalanine--D-glutamate ligase
MNAFAGERAVVVGLGASGIAAARVLQAEGADVTVTERRPREQVPGVAEMEAEGVRVLAGGHRPEHLDGATLVVTSPGVPEREPVLQWAADRTLPVWSEIELGARLARVPYVAVTGTNGKSTTTEMVAAAMRAGDIRAVACGNIGYPFSLAAREDHQALVVEVSSFQLRHHVSFHPRVSVLLNLAPDHLDWHGTFGAYAAAKARVFELQEGSDVHVGNADDAAAAEVSRRAPCAVRWFRMGEPRRGEVGYAGGDRRDGDEGGVAGGELVYRDGVEVALGLPSGAGGGFRADAAAAAATALAFGVDATAVREGIASVEPLPHRGQVVAEAGGVRFVDDSKATNPHAALAALDGMRNAVLIAGGQAKGVDLSPLASAIPSLAGVVAIGEAAPQVAAVFDGRVPLARAASIEQAARDAFAMAPRGGAVVLAPACASQDMFRDYAERGERFTAAARELAAVHAGGEPVTGASERTSDGVDGRGEAADG